MTRKLVTTFVLLIFLLLAIALLSAFSSYFENLANQINALHPIRVGFVI